MHDLVVVDGANSHAARALETHQSHYDVLCVFAPKASPPDFLRAPLARRDFIENGRRALGSLGDDRPRRRPAQLRYPKSPSVTCVGVTFAKAESRCIYTVITDGRPRMTRRTARRRSGGQAFRFLPSSCANTRTSSPSK
jgi:hypothetical protein